MKLRYRKCPAFILLINKCHENVRRPERRKAVSVYRKSGFDEKSSLKCPNWEMFRPREWIFFFFFLNDKKKCSPKDSTIWEFTSKFNKLFSPFKHSLKINWKESMNFYKLHKLKKTYWNFYIYIDFFYGFITKVNLNLNSANAIQYYSSDGVPLRERLCDPIVFIRIKIFVLYGNLFIKRKQKLSGWQVKNLSKN